MFCRGWARKNQCGPVPGVCRRFQPPLPGMGPCEWLPCSSSSPSCSPTGFNPLCRGWGPARVGRGGPTVAGSRHDAVVSTPSAGDGALREGPDQALRHAHQARGPQVSTPSAGDGALRGQMKVRAMMGNTMFQPPLPGMGPCEIRPSFDSKVFAGRFNPLCRGWGPARVVGARARPVGHPQFQPPLPGMGPCEEPAFCGWSARCSFQPPLPGMGPCEAAATGFVRWASAHRFQPPLPGMGPCELTNQDGLVLQTVDLGKFQPPLPGMGPCEKASPESEVVKCLGFNPLCRGWGPARVGSACWCASVGAAMFQPPLPGMGPCESYPPGPCAQAHSRTPFGR
jgi:hypothetical protein